jgi:tetratricopeptide (TPR) repeat protein
MAIGEYTRAIGRDSQFRNAYFYRAYSYSELGQDQNAIEDYTTAIQITPGGPAYNNRSISYKALGLYANANADIAQACSFDDKYCPPPTPTPRPTFTPTPSYRYSMAFIEDLVFDSLLGCLVQNEWIEWMPANNKAWQTSYLGNGLWTTEVIYDNQTFGQGYVVGSLDMGIWHTYESTGAVVPFDGTARTYSDCAR